MKCKSAVLFILIFLTSTCAQDSKTGSYITTEQVVVYDSTQALVPRYYIPYVFVDPGDTLYFSAKMIETPVIFLVPRANEIFEKNNSYEIYDEEVIGGVKFLKVIVDRKSEWVSKKFNIKNNPEQTEEERFPYGAYLPERKDWAEGDSSPVIIVRPGS